MKSEKLHHHDHHESHQGKHEHHHHHHSIKDASELTKAFIWGISLNVIYVILEGVYGFAYDSMGLLSDAGHNLSDVAALLLSLFGIRLGMKKANVKFTYGYKKGSILISLLNAIILFVAVAFIIVESIEKLITPTEVKGLTVAWVAGIGVVVNVITMLLFRENQKSDLNVKGAYLHMMADALVSVGVVISGVVIHFTGWYILDPIIGLIVAGVIIISAWELLRESLRLSVDAVPQGIELEDIRRKMMENLEVIDVHHIHIWPISTTENALTAHVKIKDIQNIEHVKVSLKKMLSEEGISHSTLEMESSATNCCDAMVSAD